MYSLVTRYTFLYFISFETYVFSKMLLLLLVRIRFEYMLKRIVYLLYDCIRILQAYTKTLL